MRQVLVHSYVIDSQRVRRVIDTVTYIFVVYVQLKSEIISGVAWLSVDACLWILAD